MNSYCDPSPRSQQREADRLERETGEKPRRVYQVSEEARAMFERAMELRRIEFDRGIEEALRL